MDAIPPIDPVPTVTRSTYSIDKVVPAKDGDKYVKQVWTVVTYDHTGMLKQVTNTHRLIYEA